MLGFSSRHAFQAATSFVSNEYYVEITKRMPGPVLSRHQLGQRGGVGYRRRTT
jgi:hypothetical protein